MVNIRTYSLIHFVFLRLPYGFTFIGSLEINLYLKDPRGWWIENVFDCTERLPDHWSKFIKEKIDEDKQVFDEITQKCVKEVNRIKRFQWP